MAAAGNGGVIDLADLPTRPWDRFALIPGNASSDVIREATGLDETFGYPMGHDTDLLLVLTRDGELVSWAEVSRTSGSLIRLSVPNVTGYVIGTPASARFAVVDTGQSTVSGGTVIELQPVGPSP